jgi:hypothetical protein
MGLGVGDGCITCAHAPQKVPWFVGTGGGAIGGQGPPCPHAARVPFPAQGCAA